MKNDQGCPTPNVNPERRKAKHGYNTVRKDTAGFRLGGPDYREEESEDDEAHGRNEVENLQKCAGYTNRTLL
jgi:hypothetical protein